MKAVRELKSILPQIYRAGTLSRQDVHFIMGKTREVLERNGKYREQFPVLLLFCNWCFHSQLTRSPVVYRSLLLISQKVSKAIRAQVDAKDATNAFIKAAGNLLNIPTLRKGLGKVLDEYSIDSKLTADQKCWEAFVQLLLAEVSQKPLQFPKDVLSGTAKKGKAARVFSELMQLPHDRNWDKVIRIEIRNNGSVFQIALMTLGNVEFVVELQGKERPEAFS